MQISAPPNDDTLDLRSLLAIAGLLLTGLLLLALAAFRFGLWVPGNGVTAAGDLTISADRLAFGAAHIRLPAGEPLTLVLENGESLPHSFDVDALGLHLEMPAGRSVTATVDGLPAGTYTFYCAVPGHRDAGMVGTLVVEE